MVESRFEMNETRAHERGTDTGVAPGDPGAGPAARRVKSASRAAWRWRLRAGRSNQHARCAVPCAQLHALLSMRCSLYLCAPTPKMCGRHVVSITAPSERL